jgi:aminopeptidase YwaD
VNPVIPTVVAAAAGFLLVAPLAVSAQTCPDPGPVTSGLSLPLSAVRYLADDGLKGRLAGSDGERCAGDFIAREFARLGLKPGGENGTFFQSLDLASVLNPHAPGGTGRNVIATLEGSDPELKGEWVVVGAHYDHLGEGGTPNSLAPGERAIHNGADDNASGVATVLWVAERLASGARPARSVAFIAFTGEESGLLGSAYYVNHPASGPDPIVAMINLDMVGRLHGGTLLVYGVGTAVEWTALLEPAAARAGVAIATKGDGYGPSDHTSFYLKDVPVLHFFTNTHGDYHKPSDDWEKIDPKGLTAVATIVGDVAAAAANSRPRLTLKRGAGEPPKPGSGTSRGYGAWLGSVPDFTPVERGVKLSGVTKGSPADTAGIRAGDVIVGLGTHDVADLQGMTDALRAHKPGDVVDVQVLRGGERVTLKVTLGSRANR